MLKRRAFLTRSSAVEFRETALGGSRFGVQFPGRPRRQRRGASEILPVSKSVTHVENELRRTRTIKRNSENPWTPYTRTAWSSDGRNVWEQEKYGEKSQSYPRAGQSAEGRKERADE